MANEKTTAGTGALPLIPGGPPAGDVSVTPEPKVPEAKVTEVKAKVRSETEYPYFGLTKVVEIAKAIQRVAGNAAAPASAVLAELGIAKSDRMWSYGIPASMYFGLVERIARGDNAQVKLTDLGRRIALPGTPEEERATKAAAFKMPELYAKLLDQFAGAPIPTKDVLKNILMRDHGIVESMSGNAAEAFLDSLKVADLITATGVVALDNAPRVEEKPKQEKPGDGAGDEKGSSEEFIKHVFQLRRDLKITLPLPPDLTMKDVERLHRWMQTLPIEDAGT